MDMMESLASWHTAVSLLLPLQLKNNMIQIHEDNKGSEKVTYKYVLFLVEFFGLGLSYFDHGSLDVHFGTHLSPATPASCRHKLPVLQGRVASSCNGDHKGPDRGTIVANDHGVAACAADGYGAVKDLPGEAPDLLEVDELRKCTCTKCII